MERNLMDTYGQHVIAELSDCQHIEHFDNEEHLRELLLSTAKAANATILSVHTHKFEPQGISGFVYLAESHIALHAFPEHGYIAFDCSTCGDTTSPEKALEFFAAEIGAQTIKYTFIERGIPHENGFINKIK